MLYTGPKMRKTYPLNMTVKIGNSFFIAALLLLAVPSIGGSGTVEDISVVELAAINQIPALQMANLKAVSIVKDGALLSDGQTIHVGLFAASDAYGEVIQKVELR